MAFVGGNPAGEYCKLSGEADFAGASGQVKARKGLQGCRNHRTRRHSHLVRLGYGELPVSGLSTRHAADGRSQALDCL